ncbi:MAG: XrtA/PEP-CTERM system TPR-repeat protein PrsT [Pseudomonadota bacterium]
MMFMQRVRHAGVAMAALMLLSSCGGDVPTPELISRAVAASDEGRYREAIIDLRNAVANEPNNAQARFELGSATLRLGDAASAEKELRRARDLGYDAQPTIPKMAEALILLGRPREALAELANAEEQSATILGLAGLAYETDRNADRALRAYQGALKLDPNEERALLGVARSALAKGDRVVAEEAFSKAVAAHGDSPRVRLDYGRYLYSRGRVNDAVDQYQQGLAQPLAQQQRPVSWDLHLSMAEAQLATGDLEGAAESIETLNQLQPDHVLVKYLRARIAFESKDLALASELAARVVVEAPQFEAGQMLQATINLSRQEYAQARLVLERLAKRNPNDPQVRKLLAAAQAGGENRGTEGDAGAGALSQDAVMSLLGAANAETGDFGSAVVLWERVLRENPGDEETRLELITAYMLGQRLEEAQTLLGDGQWSTPQNEERAAVLDALVTLRGDDLPSARAKAAQAAQRFPESAPAVSLQGLIEMRQDTALASRFFRRALELDPGHTSSMINLSSIAVANGDVDRATALLRTFVDNNPDNAIALDALARTQLRAGDVEGARANLERARGADPKAVAARLQLIELQARDGNFVDAEEVARELVAVRPSLPSAHNALGIAQLGQGKMDEGMASLRTALRIEPSSIEPLRNLARAEFATNDRVQAQQTVDQLLRYEPNDSVGLELATRLAIGEGSTDLAESLLAKLVEATPEGTGTLSTMLNGDIALARGQLDEAIGAYEAAFAERQASPLVMRLFEARARRGDADPDKVLRQWLESSPTDGTVRLAAAQYSQGKGDLSQAAADYELLLEQNESNVVAWNNLAWAYSELRDPRALEAAKNALDLASASPAIQDTYGWMLILDGQLENGVSMLRDAWEAAPSNGDIGYHLAAGLARAGDMEEARTVLTRALEAGGGFSTRSEAEQLMGEL